jgi:hypothetical protein
MMKRMDAHRPSAAMVVAVVALIAALSGSAVADNAVEFAKTKVLNGKNIKKKSIAGNKLRNNTITGTQVNESKLGKVPSASQADNATSAANATNATNATNASNAANASALGGKTQNQLVMWAVVNSGGTLNRSSGPGISSSQIAAGRYRVTFPIDVNKCSYNVNGGAPGGVTDPNALVKDYAVVANDSNDTKSMVYATVNDAGVVEGEPGFVAVFC